MKAIRIHELGGPEVLKYEDCPDPEPGPGQVLIDVQAVGVNYTDIQTRRGSPGGGRTDSLLPRRLPLIPGIEAAGVVSALGEGVTEVSVGDTVAYWQVLGSYAQLVAVPVDSVVPVPEGLGAAQAAGSLVQGLTAHYLALDTYPLKPGDTALVHSGAGGTGLLLVQIAKRAGARVIATVSNEEKADLVREMGADQAIIYTRDDFEEEVKKATGGLGVQVVYDAVGKTTFDKGLNCLAPLGCMVLYGQASGPVNPVDPARLSFGSLFLTRPTLSDYIKDRAEQLRRTGGLMGWLASGDLKLHIGGSFPLAEAAEAHRLMESRRSSGKLLLIPPS